MFLQKCMSQESHCTLAPLTHKQKDHFSIDNESCCFDDLVVKMKPGR